MQSPLLLTGIGLRAPHYQDILDKRPKVAWFEVHSENYFGEGGKALTMLAKIREHYPISFHGVGLSLGSSDELNWNHLRQLRDLITHIQPCLISEHLSWSSLNGQHLHDLLPLPLTQEVVDHVVSRIQQVQDYLKQSILIENISSYVSFSHSTLSEPEFLCAVAKQSGCGILLDVNNIYVSANNLDFEPEDYLAAIPSDFVKEIHLAGFTSVTIDDKEVLIDSHNKLIVPAVWDLYRKAIEQLGCKPTIIEWDSNIPRLDTLCLEAYRAERIMREVYDPAKLTG